MALPAVASTVCLTLDLVLVAGIVSPVAPTGRQPTLAPRIIPTGGAARGLAVSPRGAVWVVMESGVRRIDGATHRAWSGRGPDSPNRDPFSVAVLDEDETWVGFASNEVQRRIVAPFYWLSENGDPGLWSIFQGRWREVPPPPGQEALWVTALAADGYGGAWVGTRHGVWHFSHGQWQSFTGGLLNAPILAITATDQRVIIGSTLGAVVITEGHAPQTLLTGLPVTAVARNSANDTWLGSTESVIHFLADGKRHDYTTRDGLPDGEVHAFLTDGPGVAWIGTATGLARIAEGTVIPYRGPPLIGHNITGLVRDHEGDFFVSMRDGGLARMERLYIDNIGRSEGLPGTVAHAVIATQHAKTPALWISSNRGLSRLANGVASHLFANRQLPDGIPGSLAESPSGEIWLLYREGLLVRVDPETLHAAQVGTLTDARALAFSSDGALWIGNIDGSVARFAHPQVLSNGRNDPNTLTPAKATRLYKAADGLCAGPLRFLIPRKEGEGTGIWVTNLKTGFASLDEQGGKCFHDAMGLPNPDVATVFEASDGSLYVGLDHDQGLMRMKDGVVRRWRETDGLYCDSIFGIADDELGHLWTACGGGAQRIDQAELDYPDSKRLEHVVGVLGDDGFRSQEATATDYPIATFGPDGRFWIAMVAGASAILPAIADRTWPPLQLKIDEVTADGQTVALDNAQLDIQSRGVTNLAFQYSAPRFTAPDRISFRHRLDPYDNDWSSDPFARYLRLPPGQYRFRTQAIPLRGPLPAVETTLSVTLRPPFFLTWWFRLLMVTLAIAAVAAILLARMRRARQAQQIARDERNRIARDLHDTLGQGFTMVGLHLELLRQRLGNERQDTRELVEQTVQLLERSHEDAKGSIWALRREGDPDLLGGIRIEVDRASSAATAAGAKLTFTVADSVSGATIARKAMVTHELPLMIREGVTNALRHGRAKNIDISLLLVQGTSLVLSIRDDGVGMPEKKPSPSAGHLGLLSMQERAHQLGATLIFLTPEGGGTEIRLTLDLNKT